jgi:hypothetical protein
MLGIGGRLFLKNSSGNPIKEILINWLEIYPNEMILNNIKMYL